MIDTDKEVKNILFDLGVEGNEYGDLVEYISNLLAEVKRLSALADALFNLIPSHLSTEATDVWNEHMGDEEE